MANTDIEDRLEKIFKEEDGKHCEIHINHKEFYITFSYKKEFEYFETIGFEELCSLHDAIKINEPMKVQETGKNSNNFDLLFLDLFEFAKNRQDKLSEIYDHGIEIAPVKYVIQIIDGKLKKSTPMYNNLKFSEQTEQNFSSKFMKPQFINCISPIVDIYRQNNGQNQISSKILDKLFCRSQSDQNTKDKIDNLKEKLLKSNEASYSALKSCLEEFFGFDFNLRQSSTYTLNMIGKHPDLKTFFDDIKSRMNECRTHIIKLEKWSHCFHVLYPFFILFNNGVPPLFFQYKFCENDTDISEYLDWFNSFNVNYKQVPPVFFIILPENLCQKQQAILKSFIKNSPFGININKENTPFVIIFTSMDFKTLLSKNEITEIKEDKIENFIELTYELKEKMIKFEKIRANSEEEILKNSSEHRQTKEEIKKLEQELYEKDKTLKKIEQEISKQSKNLEEEKKKVQQKPLKKSKSHKKEKKPDQNSLKILSGIAKKESDFKKLQENRENLINEIKELDNKLSEKINEYRQNIGELYDNEIEKLHEEFSNNNEINEEKYSSHFKLFYGEAGSGKTKNIKEDYKNSKQKLSSFFICKNYPHFPSFKNSFPFHFSFSMTQKENCNKEDIQTSLFFWEAFSLFFLDGYIDFDHSVLFVPERQIQDDNIFCIFETSVNPTDFPFPVKDSKSISSESFEKLHVSNERLSLFQNELYEMLFPQGNSISNRYKQRIMEYSVEYFELAEKFMREKASEKELPEALDNFKEYFMDLMANYIISSLFQIDPMYKNEDQNKKYDCILVPKNMFTNEPSAEFTLYVIAEKNDKSILDKFKGFEFQGNEVVKLVNVYGKNEDEMFQLLAKHIGLLKNYNNHTQNQYKLSSLSFFKILKIMTFIYFKFNIILQGRAGCGKTAMIEYIHDLINDTQETVYRFCNKITCHGGLTKDLFEKELKKVCNSNNCNSTYKIVFVDEMNTAAGYQEIEYLFNNSFNLKNNIILIGAINPLEKSSEISDYLSSFGMKQNLANEYSEFKYFVHPIQESTKQILFDFVLDQNFEEEEILIRNIIESKKLLDEQDEQYQNDKNLLINIVKNSMNWYREFFDEKDVVSYRDVIRYISFFIESKRGSMNNTPEEAIKISTFLTFILRLPQEIIIEKNSEIDKHLQKKNKDQSSLLFENEKYREENTFFLWKQFIDKVILKTNNPSLKGKNEIEKEIKGVIDLYKTKYSDYFKKQFGNVWNEEFISKNGIWETESLKSILFFIDICLETNNNPFILGLPGTSKTFSVYILSLLKSLEIHITTYLCSRGTSEEGLQSQLLSACLYKLENERKKSIVFLDEMGLANANEKNPLKKFHDWLDNGIVYNQKGERLKFPIIAVSNYSPDSANFSRFAPFFAEVPSVEELSKVFKLDNNILSLLWNKQKPKILHLRSIYSIARVLNSHLNSENKIVFSDKNDDDIADICKIAREIILGSHIPKNIISFNIPECSEMRSISEKAISFIKEVSKLKNTKQKRNSNLQIEKNFKPSNLLLLLERYLLQEKVILSKKSEEEPHLDKIPQYKYLKSITIITKDYQILDYFPFVFGLLKKNFYQKDIFLEKYSYDVLFKLFYDNSDVLGNVLKLYQWMRGDELIKNPIFHFSEDFLLDKNQINANFIQNQVLNKEDPISKFGKNRFWMIGNSPIADSLLDVINSSDEQKKGNRKFSLGAYTCDIDPGNFALNVVYNYEDFIGKSPPPMASCERTEFLYEDFDEIYPIVLCPSIFKMIAFVNDVKIEDNIEESVDEDFLQSEKSIQDFFGGNTEQGKSIKDEIIEILESYKNVQRINRCDFLLNLKTLIEKYYKFLGGLKNLKVEDGDYGADLFENPYLSRIIAQQWYLFHLQCVIVTKTSINKKLQIDEKFNVIELNDWEISSEHELKMHIEPFQDPKKSPKDTILLYKCSHYDPLHFQHLKTFFSKFNSNHIFDRKTLDDIGSETNKQEKIHVIIIFLQCGLDINSNTPKCVIPTSLTWPVFYIEDIFNENSNLENKDLEIKDLETIFNKNGKSTYDIKEFIIRHVLEQAESERIMRPNIDLSFINKKFDKNWTQKTFYDINNLFLDWALKTFTEDEGAEEKKQIYTIILNKYIKTFEFQYDQKKYDTYQYQLERQITHFLYENFKPLLNIIVPHLQIYDIVSNFITKDHYKFIRDHIDEIKNYDLVDFSPLLFEPMFLPYATELFNNSMTFNADSQNIVKEFCNIPNSGSYERFFEILAHILELQMKKPEYITFYYKETSVKSFEAIFSNFRTFIGLDVRQLIEKIGNQEIKELIKKIGNQEKVEHIGKTEDKWYAFLFLMIRFYYKRQDSNTRKIEISIDGETYKPLEIYPEICSNQNYPILSYICHSFPIIYLEWTKEKTLSSYIHDNHKLIVNDTNDFNVFLPSILKKDICGKILKNNNLSLYVLSKIIFSIDLSGEEYHWEVYKSMLDEQKEIAELPEYLQYIRSIQLLNGTYDNLNQLGIQSIYDFIIVKDIKSNFLYDTNLTINMSIIPFKFKEIELTKVQPNILQSMFDPFFDIYLENIDQIDINVDNSFFEQDISLQVYLNKIYQNTETSTDLWDCLISFKFNESISKFNFISAILISIYKLYKEHNQEEKIGIYFKLLHALIDPFSSFKSINPNNSDIFSVFLKNLYQKLHEPDFKKISKLDEFSTQLNLKVLEAVKEIGIEGPYNYRIKRIQNKNYLVHPDSYIPSFVNIIWYNITFSTFEEKENYHLIFHLMKKRNVFVDWRPFIYLSMVILEMRKTKENFPIEQSDWETSKKTFLNLMNGNLDNFINSEVFKVKWKKLKLDNVYSTDEMKNWILSHNKSQKTKTKDILNKIAEGFVIEHNDILKIIEFTNECEIPISFIIPEMTYFFLDFETFVGYIITKLWKEDPSTDFKDFLNKINDYLWKAIGKDGNFPFVKFVDEKPFI